MILSERTRRACMVAWIAVVTFSCCIYFGYGWLQSSIIAAAVFSTCLLDFGARLFYRAGLAAMIFTILVSLGIVPHPEQWSTVIADAKILLASLK